MFLLAILRINVAFHRQMLMRIRHGSNFYVLGVACLNQTQPASIEASGKRFGEGNDSLIDVEAIKALRVSFKKKSRHQYGVYCDTVFTETPHLIQDCRKALREASRIL